MTQWRHAFLCTARCIVGDTDGNQWHQIVSNISSINIWLCDFVRENITGRIYKYNPSSFFAQCTTSETSDVIIWWGYWQHDTGWQWSKFWARLRHQNIQSDAGISQQIEDRIVHKAVLSECAMGNYYWSHDRTNISLWRHQFCVCCQATGPRRLVTHNIRWRHNKKTALVRDQ